MTFAIILLYIIVAILIIFAIAAWQEIKEIVRVSKKTQNALKLKNEEIKDIRESYDLLCLQFYLNSRDILKLKAKVKKLEASVEKFSTMAITASNHAAFVNTVWKNEERKARHAKKETQVIDDANEIRQEPLSEQ